MNHYVNSYCGKDADDVAESGRSQTYYGGIGSHDELSSAIDSIIPEDPLHVSQQCPQQNQQKSVPQARCQTFERNQNMPQQPSYDSCTYNQTAAPAIVTSNDDLINAPSFNLNNNAKSSIGHSHAMLEKRSNRDGYRIASDIPFSQQQALPDYAHQETPSYMPSPPYRGGYASDTGINSANEWGDLTALDPSQYNHYAANMYQHPGIPNTFNPPRFYQQHTRPNKCTTNVVKGRRRVGRPTKKKLSSVLRTPLNESEHLGANPLNCGPDTPQTNRPVGRPRKPVIGQLFKIDMLDTDAEVVMSTNGKLKQPDIGSSEAKEEVSQVYLPTGMLTNVYMPINGCKDAYRPAGRSSMVYRLDNKVKDFPQQPPHVQKQRQILRPGCKRKPYVYQPVGRSAKVYRVPTKQPREYEKFKPFYKDVPYGGQKKQETTAAKVADNENPTLDPLFFGYQMCRVKTQGICAGDAHVLASGSDNTLDLGASSDEAGVFAPRTGNPLNVGAPSDEAGVLAPSSDTPLDIGAHADGAWVFEGPTETAIETWHNGNSNCNLNSNERVCKQNLDNQNTVGPNDNSVRNTASDGGNSTVQPTITSHDNSFQYTDNISQPVSQYVNQYSSQHEHASVDSVAFSQYSNQIQKPNYSYSNQATNSEYSNHIQETNYQYLNETKGTYFQYNNQNQVPNSLYSIQDNMIDSHYSIKSTESNSQYVKPNQESNPQYIKQVQVANVQYSKDSRTSGPESVSLVPSAAAKCRTSPEDPGSRVNAISPLWSTIDRSASSSGSVLRMPSMETHRRSWRLSQRDRDRQPVVASVPSYGMPVGIDNVGNTCWFGTLVQVYICETLAKGLA